MSSALEPSLGNSQMRLLLVGESDQDFQYLRDLFGETANGLIQLQHVHSVEDAFSHLQRAACDLLLCDYRSGNGTTLNLLHQVRHNKLSAPVVVLSDHINQMAMAEAIKAAAAACRERINFDESSIIPTITHAIEMYCDERHRQRAESMLPKLWSAVDQAAELIAITDYSGIVEYANPAFEKLTGYSRDELVGHNLRMLKSEEESPETYQQMWETIIAGNIFRGIVVNRKKNGDSFIVEKTIAPVRDDTGKTTHFVSCDRDITERRRLELQLQQAQKMDAIGRLAGGIAHDFNNLLMIVSAYAELMLDSLATEHPLRRNVQQILTASRRAADLTRQLLAFSRKQMQALQVLDLNPVIQEIGKMLPRLIGEDIQLAFTPGANLDKVKADPVQIEQIVMNLAANARDAMPDGGKLTIETANIELDEHYVQKHSIVPPGNYVLLAVTDTGQGIAPLHLTHIFEPFYTTKAEGKGTGLGLATVYGIVKQNGGFIWVYSEPGLGSTFKIYLPRAAQQTANLRPTHVAEDAPPGSETLLLVEDEDAVRQSTCEFLALNGYTVLEARNGEEALRVARDFSGVIDLMITDVVMPLMGGAQVAKQLTAERRGIRVLFVSGYAESTVLRQGAIDLVGHFLQKPFTLKTLARKIREVLQMQTEALSAAAASD
jgi:two-component system cell cycle sensor histidine kinase/response regulator CckA